MIIGIHHLAISTGDFERSLHFYRDLLGMELVDDTEFSGELYETLMRLKQARGRAALLRMGATCIELFEFQQPQGRPGEANRPVCDHGYTHFCLAVTDVQADYERLKAAGVEFHCEPQSAAGAKVTYGRDPDGNVFELLQLPN